MGRYPVIGSGADCKSAGLTPSGGSSPSLPTSKRRECLKVGPMSAKHLTVGSIPTPVSNKTKLERCANGKRPDWKSGARLCGLQVRVLSSPQCGRLPCIRPWNINKMIGDIGTVRRWWMVQLQVCSLTGKIQVSKTWVLGSVPGGPAKSIVAYTPL